jgi:transcriptional regulator with XRE-family HTH domain
METDNKSNGFGRLLKFWRKTRGISQEALALSLESSTRHISCLENGKARPSLAMVNSIAKELDIGVRDRCYLSLAAGYQAQDDLVDFNSPEYKWLRKAMLMTLKALDPFPSVLTDRYGKILMVNRGWVAFHQSVLTPEALARVTNCHRFLFERPRCVEADESWKSTLAMILMSIHQEALLTGDPVYLEMLKELSVHKDVDKDWQDKTANLEPMASYRVQMEYGGEVRSFFSVSQMVGAMGPTSFVSEPCLALNTLYPEDESQALNLDIGGKLEHPLLPY